MGPSTMSVRSSPPVSVDLAQSGVVAAYVEVDAACEQESWLAPDPDLSDAAV